MPRDTAVLCMHCNQYISRARELAHRKKQHAPLYSPPPRIPSRLRHVFDIDAETEGPSDHDTNTLSHTHDAERDAPDLRGVEDLICGQWTAHVGNSDDEEENHLSIPDDEDDVFNWGINSALSPWDQLGEGYAQDSAKIGEFMSKRSKSLQHGADHNTSHAAERLSAYDLAICRAFSYKVQTHTADEDFQKLPYAFPMDNPLPKLDAIRSRITFLSGLKPEQYDRCPQGCCCFVGPHTNLSKCPYCGWARYHPDGRPRKKYTYIPIIPRLVGFLGNRHIAEQMQYRAHVHQHVPGRVTDVFDGSHYRSLQGRNVELHGRKLAHRYFADHRDVALGLSTDGFAPFKGHKYSAWAFILFNYNLPPDVRFHIQNILALGAVGPKKPVDPDSFLWPVIQELLRLLVGVRAFDILTSTLFLLRAFLILGFGDLPAIAMLMNMKGHNGILPCRMCNIIGLRIPGSRATTHYVPLARSNHPSVKADRDAVKVYDPNNLPLRTHDEMIAQANEVQIALKNGEANDISKVYGIKGISILSYLPSISFPISFPYDFMHLIWENVIPKLIKLWTGNYKGLDQGSEAYEIPKAVWEAIGIATAASGSSIPSAYGPRVPNIANDNAYFTADMWSFWTTYIGPVVLRRRFQRPKYYAHFVRLVRLLTVCLQFEITDAEIEELGVGFIRWVQEYEQ
jgi:hypothetical protein